MNHNETFSHDVVSCNLHLNILTPVSEVATVKLMSFILRIGIECKMQQICGRGNSLK